MQTQVSLKTYKRKGGVLHTNNVIDFRGLYLMEYLKLSSGVVHRHSRIADLHNQVGD